MTRRALDADDLQVEIRNLLAELWPAPPTGFRRASARCGHGLLRVVPRPERA